MTAGRAGVYRDEVLRLVDVELDGHRCLACGRQSGLDIDRAKT
jgi:hypothetical protein